MWLDKALYQMTEPITEPMMDTITERNIRYHANYEFIFFSENLVI